MTIKADLRAECIRLRTEDRLSLRSIHKQTGVSVACLSLWLRSHKLTDAEVAARCVVPPPHKKPVGAESELHRITRSNNPSTSHVGRISEAAVLLRLLAHGFSVYGSPFDGDRVDWVVDTGVRLIRLQVKTARQGAMGLPFVSIRRSHQKVRYEHMDFDFLVGFDLFTDVAYVWSRGEILAKTTAVTICPEAEERWDKLKI